MRPLNRNGHHISWFGQPLKRTLQHPLLCSLLLLWLLLCTRDKSTHWPQFMIEQVQFKKIKHTYQCSYWWLPRWRNRRTIHIHRSHKMSIYLCWSGFCHLKEQRPPPAPLSSASLTTALPSLGKPTSLAIAHTAHEIASTVLNLLIPLMSHDRASQFWI